MSESFVVKSRLDLQTNAEQVLNQLIEAFEKFDKIVKGSQGEITGFEKKVGELSGEGSAFGKAFAELKLPSGVLTDLNNITETARSFAAESANAARSWREIAEASKNIKTPSNMPSGGGNNSGGGGGRGRGRNGGGGDEEGEGPVTPFGVRDDFANARWLNQDFNAKQKAAADQERALDRAEAEKFTADYSLAMRENLDRDIQARNAEREAQHKFDDDYRLAMRENLDRDIKFKNDERAAQKKFDDDYRAAMWENLNKDQAEAKAEREERRKFNNDYMLANHENRDRDIQTKNKEDEEKQATKAAQQNRHDWGNAGVGLQVLTQGPMEFLKNSILDEVGVEEQLNLLRHNNTLKQSDIDDVRKRAMEIDRLVPGSDPSSNIKHILDLFTLTNNLKESMDFAPQLSEAEVVFEHLPGKHKGDHAFAAAQAAELLQRVYNKDTHEIDSQEFIKAIQMQERVAIQTAGRDMPEDYRAMAKQSRAAGILADDQYLEQDLPALLIALGGHRTGTAMTGGYREFIRGTMTQDVAEQLRKAGWLDNKAVWEHGRVQDMDKHFVGFDLMMHNPVEWMREFGIPSLKERGVDINNTAQVETAITPKGSTNVVLGWLSELVVGMKMIDQEAKKNRETDRDEKGNPKNPMDVVKEYSPQLKIDATVAAIKEFQVTIGHFLVGDSMKGLQTLTAGIHALDDMLNAHPNIGGQLTEIAAGFTALAYATGSLLVVSFLGGPVVTLVKQLGKLAAALVPFGEGGIAAAGLKGLEAGAESLAAKVAVKAAPAVAVAGATGGVFAGLSLLGLIGGTVGAYKSGKDIAEHGEKGQMPIMLDDFGNAIGYTKPKPESLVGPQASGPKGTSSDPLVVHVQNQTSGADIARGVSSFQADKSARPPTGYTGTDPLMDPFGAFTGMINAPY